MIAMVERDLVTEVARFAGALRLHGVTVGLSDEVSATAALPLVDLFDRDEVAYALRAAFRIHPDDRAVFDALFRVHFTDAAHEQPVVEPLAQRASRPSARGGAGPRELPMPNQGLSEEEEVPDGHEPGYSPDVMLRRKPFDECSARDLARLEKVLDRLLVTLRARRSRRLVPTRGRGAVDLRRSFRRALATRGEFVALARRVREIDQPRLVVLCDTSGSMDPHARFLLGFVLALRRVAKRSEIFSFNTQLTRLTPLVAPGGIGRVLDRLADGVPDWSGGTRIGECLARFVADYLRWTVTSRTDVIILSDGLDRGDPEVLADAMRSIRSRARRVIWLNPLLGDARYEPTARGMAAALPHVDHFASAHNLESLERLALLLAS